jgi:hypothetical protein
MPTVQDLINAATSAATVVGTDQQTIDADQAKLAADQATLATDTTAEGAADQALAATLAATGPKAEPIYDSSTTPPTLTGFNLWSASTADPHGWTKQTFGLITDEAPTPTPTPTPTDPPAPPANS